MPKTPAKIASLLFLALPVLPSALGAQRSSSVVTASAVRNVIDNLGSAQSFNAASSCTADTTKRAAVAGSTADTTKRAAVAGSTADTTKSATVAGSTADATKTAAMTGALPVTFDVKFFDELLKSYRLFESERQAIVNDVVSVFDLRAEANGKTQDKGAVEPITSSSLACRIKAKSGSHLTDSEIAVITEALVHRPADSGPRLLASVSAAGSSDRLYSTVDVVSFAHTLPERYGHGTLEARVVTGTAVSNADTSKVDAASRKNYRQSTADMLTALREGGPLALIVGATYQPVINTRAAGVDFNFAGSVANGGRNIGDDSRNFTVGVTSELKGYLNSDPNEIANPTTLLLTLRSGWRYAAQGIVQELTDRTLWFGQGTVEFKSPKTGVPIGVAFTFVPPNYRKFTKTVQFFGIAGF